MEKHSFLIIHGLGGSGSDHWQTWLAQELTARNHHVFYPTFSNFDAPDKHVWLEELSNVIETIPDHHQLTVITHSLGCLLWLHHSANHPRKIAKKAILVAPPSPKVVLSEAKSFFPVPLDKKSLTSSAEESLFVLSSNDPYCTMEDAKNFRSIGVPSITLPNMGHINTQSGHGKWPWILDKCLAVENTKLRI